MSTRPLLAALLVCFSLGISQSVSAQQPPDAAAQPTVVLRLSNNSLLVGRVVEDKGDTIVFDAGTLGQMTLKRADIVAMLDPATVAAAFQAAQPAPPPAASMSGFAAPGKVNWTRFATFGGSITTAAFKQGQLDPAIPGLTGEVLKLPGNQYQAQGQATVVRASNMGIFFVDASITYAFFEPFGRQAELPKVSTGYNFRFNQKTTKLYGVTRYTWYKDYVRKVDYSNQLLFGLGVHAVDTPSVKLDLVPGLTAMRESKGTKFDNQWLGGFGGLEQLTFNPNKFSQIEQRELFYQVFQDSSYRGLESYVGFKGMLSKAVGVQVGMSVIYDGAIAQQVTTIPANALFPGQPQFGVLANNKTQVLTTIGMLVRF